jgi:hypothetical protein
MLGTDSSGSIPLGRFRTFHAAHYFAQKLLRSLRNRKIRIKIKNACKVNDEPLPSLATDE